MRSPSLGMDKGWSVFGVGILLEERFQNAISLITCTIEKVYYILSYFNYKMCKYTL